LIRGLARTIIEPELPQTLEARMARNCELITLVGEIDMTRAAELRAAVATYQESPSDDAQVDMSRVSFCGSEGVEFLAALLEAARTKAGTVTVINANDAVQRLLKICGLDDSLHQQRHY
jgi:anti-sigma B factor antagonist